MTTCPECHTDYEYEQTAETCAQLDRRIAESRLKIAAGHTTE